MRKHLSLSLPLLAEKIEDDNNIRDSVAMLIYDIRCKVVHTKGHYDFLLLPFSEEADEISKYMDLMQYVAFEVLEANKRKIDWP